MRLLLSLFADKVDFMKIATDLYNTSGPTNGLLRQLLQISEDDDSVMETGLSYGVIAGIVAGALVVVASFVAVTVLVITCLKRYIYSYMAYLKLLLDLYFATSS